MHGVWTYWFERGLGKSLPASVGAGASVAFAAASVTLAAVVLVAESK